MRTVDFKYNVLRNGAFFGLLKATVEAGQIRMDDSTDIKMTLQGTFSQTVEDVDGNALEPNWLTDEIQPVLILDKVEYPLGVFLPATVTPVEEGGVKSLEIEAYDRCWRVRDNYSTTSVYFAAGTNYLDAVETLLSNCGIGLIDTTPTTLTFPEAREDWQVGTSYLTIINQLLSEISYEPLHFSAFGAAILKPSAVPTADNIDHVLSENGIRILPSISQETDVYQAPNSFVCICSNFDKANPLVATAENTNPNSPLSIMRRGRKIVKVVRVNNVADADALQAYADNLRNQSMFSGETINVSTALMPNWGVRDVVGLKYGDFTAVCVSHSWEMELKVGGTMKHELERVVVNLGTS